ncbi:RHS repeat-associated core domain-containing protein [Pseudomonas sp. SIMBA_059]
MNANLHQHTPQLSAIDPRGRVVRNVAYCRTTPLERPQRRVTRTAWDGAGRAVAQWDPRLWVLHSADKQVPANLTSIYALGGAVLSTQSVDAGWRVNLLGAAGQLRQAWDGRGGERVIEYDALLRPLAVVENNRCTERYTYGATEAQAEQNQCGQLVRLDDRAGTRYFNAYGLSGEVTEQRQHFAQALEGPDWPLPTTERDALVEPGEGARTLFEFNAVGELLVQTDAANNQQGFSYTVDGHLREAWLKLNGVALQQRLASGFVYDAQGHVTEKTLGNGMLCSSQFSPENGRLLRLLGRRSNGVVLQDLHYVYDPVGNILTIEDKAQAVRHFANQRIDPISRYTYDSLSQLISATGYESGGNNRGPGSIRDPHAVANFQQTYRYDTAGNLLELTHVGAQSQGRVLTAAKYSNRCLPELDGRPPSEADIAAGFDANGNLLELHKGRTLAWDSRNQLVQVQPVERDSTRNDTERYCYAADGTRLRKVRTEQTSSRELTRETRYLPGLEVRRVDAEILQVITVRAGEETVQVLHWETAVPRSFANDQYRYHLGDYLGSCSLELDSQARVISREAYHPYGSTAFTERGDSSEASYRTLRYSGNERDATGLYCYRLRYYAPWLNRWVNSDPGGAIDGLNFFRFVRNNPCTLIDREGLVPQVPEKVEENEFKEVSESLVSRMEGVAKSQNKSKKSAEADLKKINNSGKKNLQKEAVQSEKLRLEALIKSASEKEQKANQAAIMFGEYAREGDKYVLKDDNANSVGVMSLTDDIQSKAKKIETIATDVETSGNGAILIAHAVNESERAGLEGVVTLVDVSAGSDNVGDPSKNVYSYFGFETIDGEPGKMKLVPSHSALWKKNGKTWERVRRREI